MLPTVLTAHNKRNYGKLVHGFSTEKKRSKFALKFVFSIREIGYMFQINQYIIRPLYKENSRYNGKMMD
jgi:hypothetical protein